MLSRRASGLLPVFALLLWLCAATASAQGGTTVHKVAPQETLYGLSRQYGVEIDDLFKANPRLKEEGLKAGREIRIPTSGKKQAKTKAVTVQKTGSAASRSSHKVTPGETLWSIARLYSTDVASLMRENPQMQTADYVLQAGETIYLPEEVRRRTENEVQATAAPVVKRSLSIAILMPLKSKRAETPRCVEFYRGLLMAADRLKENGSDVTLYTYEEAPDDAEQFARQLADIRQRGVDVVFGPLYPGHFESVCRLARETGTRVVIPFSSRVPQVSSCPELVVVNTPGTMLREAAARLFTDRFRGYHTVFLETKTKNEAEFTAQLNVALAKAGMSGSTLPNTASAATLAAIGKTHPRIIIVPDDHSEAALRYAVARLEQLRADCPSVDVSLFGYADWLTPAKDLEQKLYTSDAYLFTQNFFNARDAATQKFEAVYDKWFDEPLLEYTPRYAPLGYDVGLHVMTLLLNHGKTFSTQTVSTPYLQTQIKLRRAAEGGGLVNENVWFIHFTPSHAKERISSRR